MSVGNRVAAGLFLLLAAGIHGAITEFVPAPALIATPTLVGVWLATWLALVAGMRRTGANPRITKGEQFFSIPVLSLFLAYWIWLALAKGAATLATAAIGTPYTVDSEVTLLGNDRKGCGPRLEGGLLDGTYPGTYCVTSAFFDVDPSPTQRMRFRGLHSPLGFRIESVERLPIRAREPR